jgi:hypothetical protein
MVDLCVGERGGVGSLPFAVVGWRLGISRLVMVSVSAIRHPRANSNGTRLRQAYGVAGFMRPMGLMWLQQPTLDYQLPTANC